MKRINIDFAARSFFFGIAFIILLCLCFSCKSTKIQRKDCEEITRLALLSQKPKPDTIITYMDTVIYLPVHSVDTHFTTNTDTLWHTIIQDKVVIRYKETKDTMYLKADCPTDSVKVTTKETKIIQPINENVLKTSPEINWGWFGLIFLLILCLLIYTIIKNNYGDKT